MQALTMVNGLMNAVVSKAARDELGNSPRSELLLAAWKNECSTLKQEEGKGRTTEYEALKEAIRNNTEDVAIALDDGGVYTALRPQLLDLLAKEIERKGDEIMDTVTTEFGFELSRKERNERRLHTTTLTYGEVHFRSFTHILSNVLDQVYELPYEKKSEFKVFYDLGSGTGRALVGAALCHNFQKVVGIEYLESLHNAAVKVCDSYRALQQRGELPKNAASSDALAAVCGDILAYDWSDGDIIFANSTCFTMPMFRKIAEKCKDLAVGSYVITYSTELQSPYLKTVSEKEYVQSWGKCTVFTHIRIADPTPEEVAAWQPTPDWLKDDE